MAQNWRSPNIARPFLQIRRLRPRIAEDSSINKRREIGEANGSLQDRADFFTTKLPPGESQRMTNNRK